MAVGGRRSGCAWLSRGPAWAGAPRPGHGHAHGRELSLSGVPTVLRARLLLRAAAGQGKPAELRGPRKAAEKAAGKAARRTKEAEVPFPRRSLASLVPPPVSPFVKWS